MKAQVIFALLLIAALSQTLSAQPRPTAQPLPPTGIGIAQPAQPGPDGQPGFNPGEPDMPFDPGIEFPQPGRYQLISSQIQIAGKAQPQSVVLKLDTATGQVWMLQAEETPARGNVPAGTVLRFVPVIDQHVQAQPGQGRPAGGIFGGGFGGFPGGAPGGFNPPPRPPQPIQPERQAPPAPKF